MKGDAMQLRRRVAIVPVLVVTGLAVYAQHVAQPQPRTADPYPFLRLDQVRSRHIFDRTVGSNDLALTEVAINVPAAATTASSAADPVLVGGKILGYRAAGNQDVHLDAVSLNTTTGAVTITLASAAVGINNFVVM